MVTMPASPLTLVIDSVSAACSAALIDADGAVLAEAHEVVGRGHAERLVPMIAELLGWPEEERHHLRPWSAAIVRLYEKDHGPDDEARADRVRDIGENHGSAERFGRSRQGAERRQRCQALGCLPFGAQTAWLSWSSTGTPPACTRVAAFTHWAVTHGRGPVGVVNGQPDGGFEGSGRSPGRRNTCSS